MFGAYIKKMACLGVLLVIVVPVMAQGRVGFGRQLAKGRGTCLITSIPGQSLEIQEQSGLIQMREEEKLARDVYQTMYSLWNDKSFQRISQSEQRHMDAMGVLLDRYGLEDPVAGKGIGEFNNAELQAMYGDLLAIGKRSHRDALKVGATIEDLDLFDLGEALKHNNNDDIKIVYGNLTRGSQNHMRAFAGRLEALGENYTPQYISEAELSGILSPRNASGAGPGRGRGAQQGGLGRGLCLRNGNTVTQ